MGWVKITLSVQHSRAEEMMNISRESIFGGSL